MKKTFDRRTFLRGTTALVAASPFAGLLGSTSALAQDAANPFGVAEGSVVDSVIFNGGYGIDYVEMAAEIMKKNHPSLTVAVNASTKIATELQALHRRQSAGHVLELRRRRHRHGPAHRSERRPERAAGFPQS